MGIDYAEPSHKACSMDALIRHLPTLFAVLTVSCAILAYVVTHRVFELVLRAIDARSHLYAEVSWRQCRVRVSTAPDESGRRGINPPA